MAKNISLLGADYPDVPAVVLPKTGGGSAMFVDADDKANKIQTITVDGTTDSDGDIQIALPPYSYSIVACYPDRLAGAGYYTSWYTILPYGTSPTNESYSVKCISDNMSVLASTKVKFKVDYIQK